MGRIESELEKKNHRLKILMFAGIAAGAIVGSSLTVLMPLALQIHPAMAALSIGTSSGVLCAFFIWKNTPLRPTQAVEDV